MVLRCCASIASGAARMPRASTMSQRYGAIWESPHGFCQRLACCLTASTSGCCVGMPSSGSRTYSCTATRRLILSYGVYDGLRQPLSLDYRSHPSNPSKDRLTPSKTTMRCLFLALRRLCQHIPALYRCEQHNLPPEGIMQILVERFVNSLQAIAAYVHIENMIEGAKRHDQYRRPFGKEITHANALCSPHHFIAKRSYGSASVGPSPFHAAIV